jgi:hypothetical protein
LLAKYEEQNTPAGARQPGTIIQSITRKNIADAAIKHAATASSWTRLALTATMRAFSMFDNLCVNVCDFGNNLGTYDTLHYS